MTEYVDVERARQEFKEKLTFDRNFRRPSHPIRRKASPVTRAAAFVAALVYLGTMYWLTR